MGLAASLMKGKVTPAQWKGVVYGNLYDKFIKDGGKKMDNFDDFHTAILEMITTINQIIPGRHYDVPELQKIKDVFKEWEKEADDEKKKAVVKEFIMKNVHMREVDVSMILTGLAAPPAAMVAKRAGQSLPQLKIIKLVPDLVFVPSATLLAIAACRLSSTWNKVHQ